jgi:hypothetical protein
VAAFSALRVALALGLAQALVIVKKWGKGTFTTSFRRRINDKDVWLRRQALLGSTRRHSLSGPLIARLSGLSSTRHHILPA